MWDCRSISRFGSWWFGDEIDERRTAGDRLIVRLNFGGKTKERERFIFIVDVNAHERRVTVGSLSNR
jgi:hypothetical protein